MANSDKFLILGASTRAAAFSALRAGLTPWCADLFADADLHMRCHVERVIPHEYPQCFVKLAENAPAGPWMYTGALENHPAIVERIGRRRPLWGFRSPQRAAGDLLQPSLETRRECYAALPDGVQPEHLSADQIQAFCS